MPAIHSTEPVPFSPPTPLPVRPRVELPRVTGKAAVAADRWSRPRPGVVVAVRAGDPVSEAGVVSQLRTRSEVELVDDASAAVVVVVLGDAVDEATLARVRAAHPARVVLVVTALNGAGLLAAVKAGVQGVVRRGEATGARLAVAVTAAAAGDGTLPPDLLGKLLAHGGDGERRTTASAPALTYGGLSQRELDVLRLLADGLSTVEIARRLAYSERTIKNAIHELTTRLQLRNRVHAVAYAVREGLI